MLDAKMVLRLRERGLVLSEGGKYATPRLAEVVARQAALMKEMAELDAEVKAMAEKD